VHLGFLQQLQWIESSTFDNLLRLNTTHPNANIAFVGHSLGGVLAHLSAIYAVKEYGFDAKRIIVQTSGQPRTGDAELVKLSRSCNFAHYSRLVNQLDLIPYVPPVGYAHDGQVLMINLDGTISTRFPRAAPAKYIGSYHEKYLNADFGPCAR
jgi:predicted lipase